jgi:hypothetical protein
MLKSYWKPILVGATVFPFPCEVKPSVLSRADRDHTALSLTSLTLSVIWDKYTKGTES